MATRLPERSWLFRKKPSSWTLGPAVKVSCYAPKTSMRSCLGSSHEPADPLRPLGGATWIGAVLGVDELADRGHHPVGDRAECVAVRGGRFAGERAERRGHT